MGGRPPLAGSVELRTAALSSDSPSRAANNRNGFLRFEQLSRSPLHHKVGLCLTSFLHEGKVGEQVQQLFPNLVKSSPDLEEDESLDRILIEGFRSWRKLPIKKRTEPSLTGAIFNGIDSALKSQSGCTWTVKKEARVGKGATTGRVDILLQRHDAEAKAEVVPALAVEVGRHNDEWWSKLDQGMEYVRLLGSFREPFLLVVLTFSEPQHRGKTFLLDTARIGVFLVTPRSDPSSSSSSSSGDNFRLSMLWRGQTSDVDSLSRDFGRALRAALLLPCWSAASMDYDYLGPNCCRVGSNALRAYDNRLMYTARRPDVYLDFLADETSEICSYADHDTREAGGGDDETKAHPLPFGEHVEGSDTRDWVWQFRGKITVISVPFYEGRHHARRIGEFIPVLRQLKRLHEAGYVHGDLRCCNVVFVAGRLIDFDFGGTLDRERGSPTYPRGYKQVLIDGDRRGTAGQSVTLMDDLYAMTSIVFSLHKIQPPSAADDPGAQDSFDYYRKLAALNETMRSLIAFAESNDDDFESVELDVSGHIETLISFLEEVEGSNWTVTPKASMVKALANYGYAVTGLQGTLRSRKATGPATGSPSKGIFV